MKILFLLAMIFTFVSCDEVQKNASDLGRSHAPSERMVPWGEEMITEKESALRRIGDNAGAADLYRGMAEEPETYPTALVDYENALRMVNDTKAEARRLGATEKEIIKYENEFWALDGKGPGKK